MDSVPKLAIICAIIFVAALEAKQTIDPYKVLGVEKTAGEGEIQKAFHKLSLQYHPDKNNNKGAQEKFEEINNAYETLSDEDKRKNYDLYGDEEVGPFFDVVHATDPFSFGGANGRIGLAMFAKKTSDAASKTYSNVSEHDQFFLEAFGGTVAEIVEKYKDLPTIECNPLERRPPKVDPCDVDLTLFEDEIRNNGVTWVITSHELEVRQDSIGRISTFPYRDRRLRKCYALLAGVGTELNGVLKTGILDCNRVPEYYICNKFGIYPTNGPAIFVYSYSKSFWGTFVRYGDDLDSKALESFCIQHLPRLSHRAKLEDIHFDLPRGLPEVMLLSSEKDTPIFWRALSGLYRKNLTFYDVQVRDVSDPKLTKLGVDAIPAVIGWLSNGERRILGTNITVKDLESTVKDVRSLLDGFERENKRQVCSQPQLWDVQVPQATPSDLDILCDDPTTVCIVGGFRTAKSKRKLQSILSKMAQKAYSTMSSFHYSASYAVLDARKYQRFLSNVDASGFLFLKEFIFALKVQQGYFKYAVLEDKELSVEVLQKFIKLVLVGEVPFQRSYGARLWAQKILLHDHMKVTRV